MDDDFLDTGPRVDPVQHDKALELAKLYFATFVSDPAGAELLRQWTERDFYERVPVDASLQRYAAVEARRDFIRQIYRQIEMAKKGA